MANILEFKDAFDLVLRQTATVNEYWKFYATVSLALLAGTIGSDKLKATKAISITVIGAFLLFAIGNLVAIVQGHLIVERLNDVANKLASSSVQLAGTVSRVPTIIEVCFFHVVCDICNIAAMWVIASHSWKDQKQDDSTGV